MKTVLYITGPIREYETLDTVEKVNKLFKIIAEYLGIDEKDIIVYDDIHNRLSTYFDKDKQINYDFVDKLDIVYFMDRWETDEKSRKVYEICKNKPHIKWIKNSNGKMIFRGKND